MPSWETAVGNEDSHIDLATAPVRQSAPIRLNRIKRRLIHRAALLGYKLCWEAETNAAVLLEWDGGRDKWAVGPQIKGIPAVCSFLGLLEGRGV